MPQDNLQVNSQEPQEQNPDETAAVLAFATKLSEQLLPKQPQTQEKGAVNNLKQKDEVDTAKEEKVDLEANNKEMEKMINSKLDEFKKELKATIKDEISGIKESIEGALNEDDE